ncbi:PepSY domain-containing protein [Salinicola avicenniae]|uniref:PepSY domain-containing protein n=1 Tax=Salinicola avicenniae TaxID=2916836 RepID=UPI0020738BAD|nr:MULTISPECIES: PepSY domain-containing protein [unclassified Salinicola]
MKIRHSLLLLPILPLLLSGTMLPAAADGNTWRDLHQEVKQGHLVGLTEIMDWLEARYEGQILEVELEQDDGGGRIEYEVEMIGPQGQVVEFEFDATNGELLSIEGVNIEAMRKSP